MSQDSVECLPEVYKATEYWSLPKLSILDDHTKSEDVVYDAVISTETYLASYPKTSSIRQLGYVVLENGGIKLGHGVANHDGPIVARVTRVTELENGVNNV